MRLWTIHPRYLDRQGLVALWREALLAQAVLRGQTKGYRRHPQLERFRAHPAPRYAINAYLAAVYEEAEARGYSFDRSKIGALRRIDPMQVTEAQLLHEWKHLLQKLSARNPALHEHLLSVTAPGCHPSFHVVPGGIAAWERARTDPLVVVSGTRR